MTELTDDAFRAYINDFNTFLHDIGDAPEAGHTAATADSSVYSASEADDVSQASRQQEGVNNTACSYSGEMEQEAAQPSNQLDCSSPGEQSGEPTTLDNPNYDDDYYKQSVLEELNDYNNPDWSDLDLTTASDNRLSAISEEKTSEFSCSADNNVVASGSWSENRATVEAADSATEPAEEPEEEESSVSKSSDEHEISQPGEYSSGTKVHDEFGEQVFEEQVQSSEKYSYEEQELVGEGGCTEVVEDEKAAASAAEITDEEQQCYQQEEEVVVEQEQEEQVAEKDEHESLENSAEFSETHYGQTGEISGETRDNNTEGVQAAECEENYAIEDANEAWSNQSQGGSNCEVIDESSLRSPAADDGNLIQETSSDFTSVTAPMTTSYNEFEDTGNQQNVCSDVFHEESAEETNEAAADNGNGYRAMNGRYDTDDATSVEAVRYPNKRSVHFESVSNPNYMESESGKVMEYSGHNGNEYPTEYSAGNDNRRSCSSIPVNGNNYDEEEEEEPAGQDNDRTPDDTCDKLRSPSPTPGDHISLLYSERNKPREQLERGRRPRIGRRWEAEMTRGGENAGESTTVQPVGGDDNGGSLPGRGRMKDLLAQWRQLEQQRKDEELLQRTAAVTPTRSRNVASAVRSLRPRDDNLESPSFRELKAAAQFRSQSCGPVVRGRRRQQQDQDQQELLEGSRGDDEEGQGFDKAAILAKFENLEAAAQKTTNTTGNRKKDFKWKVRETTTLSRPVGLRIVS